MKLLCCALAPGRPPGGLHACHPRPPPAGAFPELRLAQFPLDMGRPDAIRSDQTLALAVASDGGVKYDAIVKQARGRRGRGGAAGGRWNGWREAT